MADAGLFTKLTEARPYAGKTLAQRTTGRFYTPDALACNLATRIIERLDRMADEGALGSCISICDPFCGDGRLIAALLVVASTSHALRRKTIVAALRDVDAQAVRGASRTISILGAELGMSVVVRTHVGDSFGNARPETHDVVITNPPWELLKPDARETAQLSTKEAASYRAWLKERCVELDARFPDAKADVSWAGWGTNLARCGWDLSLRSCRNGGILGIVLPSTILADQASASMRRTALTRATLLDLATYPPEARLFARVDQPVVAATFLMQPSSRLESNLRVFGPDRAERALLALRMSREQLEAADYSIPVAFGAEASSMLAKFSEMPRFRDLEGSGPTDLWAGRELDETGLSSKLCRSGGRPFVKGRMICRHGLVDPPSHSVSARFAQGFRSPSFERVVWRDVSRPSQRRRMIGTIIPPGWIAGNSLHVAHFRDGDPQRLRALHAILSSYVVEFQVRSRLATGHMSLGIVRMARIPPLSTRTVATLAVVAARALADREAEVALETSVARAYGIDRDDFEVMLAQFAKVAAMDRERLLSKALWSAKAR